jgi:hypothetical protein
MSETMSTLLAQRDDMTNKYNQCIIRLSAYNSEVIGKDAVMMSIDGVNCNIVMHRVCASELRALAYICSQMADQIDPSTVTT